MYANNTSIQKEAGRSLNQQRAHDLLSQMSLSEKIGQMCQLQSGVGHIPEHIAHGIRHGEVGSVLNEVNVDVVNELQRLAVEERSCKSHGREGMSQECTHCAIAHHVCPLSSSHQVASWGSLEKVCCLIRGDTISNEG